MCPSLQFLPWLFEILRESPYKIDHSGTLWKLWDFFCLQFLIRGNYKAALRGGNKNKQTPTGKGKSQENLKTFYIHLFKILERPWNIPNKGIKLLTCEAGSSNSSNILFGHQCQVVTLIYCSEFKQAFLKKTLISLSQSFFQCFFKKRMANGLVWIKVPVRK